MTNEQKARELAIKCSKTTDDNDNEVYNAFCEATLQEMAEWKDSLPLSELDGWSTDEPTEEGFYLVETDDFPKDCRYVVARWYSDNHEFYDEAFEETITYNRWKRI